MLCTHILPFGEGKAVAFGKHLMRFYIRLPGRHLLMTIFRSDFRYFHRPPYKPPAVWKYSKCTSHAYSDNAFFVLYLSQHDRIKVFSSKRTKCTCLVIEFYSEFIRFFRIGCRAMIWFCRNTSICGKAWEMPICILNENWQNKTAGSTFPVFFRSDFNYVINVTEPKKNCLFLHSLNFFATKLKLMQLNCAAFKKLEFNSSKVKERPWDRDGEKILFFFHYKISSSQRW